MIKHLLSAIAFLVLLLTANMVYSQVFILNEDFADASVTTPPTGWQNTMVTGQPTDLWHFDNPGNRVVNLPVTAPFAVLDAENYSSGGGNETALLVSPEFDASIGTYCLLFLDHYFSGGAGSTGKIEAYNGTAWVEVQTFTTASVTNPVHEVIDLSAICAGKTNARVRFRWEGNGQGYWALDNFRLYAPLLLDAGVSSLDSPVVPFAPGVQGVSATLNNYGYQTLNSATIKWSVNGVPQVPFNWSGNISQGFEESNIPIGNYNFLSGVNYTVKVWSENPNGSPDPFHMNDSIMTIMKPALCGTFTIGGTNPDFQTISDAVLHLSIAGITCPVTFKIRNGSYNEQIDLTNVAGSSAINTITFESESGDSSQVVIGNNYGVVVNFNKIKYVNFNKLTLNGKFILKNLTQDINITNCPVYYVGGTVMSIIDSSHHILVRNCNIIGQFGYNGISMGADVHHIIIDHNLLKQYVDNAIVSGCANNIMVRNNIIENVTWNSFAVLLCGDTISIINNVFSQVQGAINVSGNGPFMVSGNKIDFAANTGITVSAQNATVCNNYITIGANGSQGLSLGGNNTVCAFNNVNVLSNSPGSAAISLNGGANNLIENNIFSNSGSGYAAFISGTMNPSLVLDYNDYYSFTNKTGFYADSTYGNFPGWVGATGKESHGVNANPYYSSNSNLTPNHILLNNTGIPVAGVTVDIDSVARNFSNPDIGAKEFNLCANDAGVEQIVSPSYPLLTGLRDIKVILRNQGSAYLTSVTILWTVNMEVQAPFLWTGTLLSGESVEVTVGQFTFLSSSQYQVVAWTDNPNNTGDCNNMNNSANSPVFYPELCGTYTIGGENPDFQSLSLAISALANGGISCPVVFNIRDMNYNIPVTIGSIPGASPINTVTFQSESNDSTKVYLSAVSSMTLSGASHIILRGISCRGIVYINASSDILFANCYITGSNEAWNTFILENNPHDIEIRNTRISNGLPFWVWGGHHIKLIHNILETGFMGGHYLNHNFTLNENHVYGSIDGVCDSSEVVNNKIVSGTISGGGTSCKIIGNKLVRSSSGGSAAGISLGILNSVIANNSISISGFHPGEGLIVSGSNSLICYNSIDVNSPSIQSSAFKLQGGNNLTIRNNIFSATGKGCAAKLIGTDTSAVSLDYNDYFSLTGRIGNFNDTLFNSLSSWSARIGGEAHGQSANPFFESDSLLIPHQYALNDAGIPVPEFLFDIDSVLRSPTVPDIGAYEFSVCSQDAGINMFSAPVSPFTSGTNEVRVVLQNHGTTNLTSVQIVCKLNNELMPAYNWTGNLAAGQSSEVSLGSPVFQATVYRLKAWTQLPNSSADCDHYNDTSVLTSVYPTLCGTYTIGGTNPNFADFTEAAEVLNNTIISCPVVFKARNGTYPGRFAIDQIMGSSPINRVTFESESGDRNSVKITDPPDIYLMHTIALSGVSDITLKNLTIENRYPQYWLDPSAVRIQNSLNDSIVNCVFTCAGTICVKATGSSRLTVSGNQFNSGSAGIILETSPNAKVNDNFLANFGSGISTGDCNPAEITHNILRNMGTGISVYSYASNDTAFVENNQVHGTTNGISISSDASFRVVATVKNNSITSVTNAGILFSTNYSWSLPNKGTIANNHVQLIGNGVTSGISLSRVSGVSLFNNSVNNMSTNMLGKAFSVAISDSLKVKNNIFSNTGGGFSCYLDAVPPGSLFDFNNYYNPSNRLGYIDGTIYPTLSSWKTAVSGESNAKNFFPYFASDSSFHIYQRNLNGAAIPVPGIVADIEGDIRNATAPDIGADEFKVDFGINEVIAPTLICNHAPGEHVVIRVKQFGDVPFFNIPVAFKVNNLPAVIDTIHGELFHDTVFTFNQPIDISSQGTYTIKCWMIGNYDDNVSNDTIFVTRHTYPSPVPDFTVAGNCEEQETSFSGIATVIPPYTISSYTWFFGDGNTSNNQNPVHVYQNQGTYNVRLQSWSNMGCYGEIYKPVIVRSVPVAHFIPSATNCQGMAVVFDDSSYTVSGSISQWIWNFGDGSFATITAPISPDVSHIYANSGVYFVVLTVLTVDSCVASATVSVTVGVAPLTEFSWSVPACLNVPVSFTDQSATNSGGPIMSWYWDFGDPMTGSYNTSAVQNPVHIFSGTGTYQVQLITGNGVCSDTIQHVIMVSPLPTITITGETVVCQGSTGVTYTTEPGMNNYAWTVSSGGTITAGSGTNTITVTWNGTGVQQVSVNYSNMGNCPASDPTVLNVTVNPLPADIGQSTTLSPAIQDGLFAYYPLDGNANDLSGNNLNGLANNVNFVPGHTSQCASFQGIGDSYVNLGNWNIPDTFSISLYMKKADYTYPLFNGQQIIAKYDDRTGNYRSFYLDLPTPDSYLRTAIHPDGSSQYLADGTTNLVTDQWYHVVATYSGSNQMRIFLNSVQEAENNNIPSTGVYNSVTPVYLGRAHRDWGTIYGQFFGSIDEVRIYNRVLTQCEINFLYSGNVTCSPLIVTVTDDTLCSSTSTAVNIVNSQPGILYHLYSGITATGNPVAGTGSTISLNTGILTQNSSFTIMATDTATGCFITLDSTFTVYVSSINADVSADTTICSGTSATITASGGTNYLWSNGATTDIVIVAPASTTTYSVTVTNTSGCVATDSVVVTVVSSGTVSVSLTASANPVCQGDTVHYTAHIASAGNNETLQWFVNGVPVYSGNYNTGLVAYYPFTGNANDESGFGHDGIVNGATPVSDKLGNPNSAYSFNGVTNYIKVPDNTSLRFGNGDFSFSTWLKYPSQAGGSHDYAAILIKSVLNYPWEGMSMFVDYPIGTGKCEFRVSGLQELYSTASNLSTNTWRHYACVRQSNVLKIYINGALDNTMTVSPVNVDNTEPLYLGANHQIMTSQNYYGLMDDVRIYNRALPPSEVLALYHNMDTTFSYVPNNGDIVTCVLTASGPCLTNNPDTSNAITMIVHPLPANLGEATTNLNQGLVASYPFNGNANDESGNGNNGSVFGSALTTDRFGVANSAYLFDGINDYIATNQHFLESAFTIQMWVRADTLLDPGTLNVLFTNGYTHGGFGNGFSGWVNPAGVKFLKAPESMGFETFTDSPVNDNVWHHLIFLWDGTLANNGVRIYVDGIIAADTTCLSAGINSTINLQFGGYITFFKGYIDDIRIYNRSLTTAEITCLYSGNCLNLTTSLYSDSICVGNNTSLMIQNSQSGIKYQMLTNGVNYGNYLTGNGSTLTFPINGLMQTTSFTVLATNATTGCFTLLDSIFTVNVSNLNAVVSPDATICNGSTTTVTASGGTGYLWSNGMTTSSITVSPPATTVYYVTVTNGTWCMDTDSVKVTVNPAPVAVITGPATACAGSAGNIYTTQAGMTGYTWVVSAGGTITAGSGTNAITVSWSTVGAKTISVNYTNSFNCTAATPAIYNVTVSSLPPATITGSSVVCQDTQVTYTTEPGMPYYIWTTNGNFIAGGSSADNWATISFPAAGSGSVNVTYNSAAGCSSGWTYHPVTVNPRPLPTIAGALTACNGSTGNVYSTEPGMTGYSWIISSGGTITSGVGTNSIMVNWNSIGLQTISVNYSNMQGCTATSPIGINIAVNEMVAPTIAGSSNMCVSSGYYDYTTQAGMTNYSWSISPGGTIIYGNGTNGLIVTWDVPGPQWVKVNYFNSGGCTATVPTQMNVTVNPLPGAAGTVTGSGSVCAGATGINYSTTLIPDAVTYVWSLPFGASIASGFGTSSILVDFGSTTQSGDITVYGNNLCGNGTVSEPFHVNVSALPGLAGTPTGDEVVCQGDTGIIYYVSPILNAVNYVWDITGGGVITTGNGTNSIRAEFPAGPANCAVTVYGSNSCGAGLISPAKYVTVNLLPPVPVITQNGPELMSNAPAGNQWYLNGTLIPGADQPTYTPTLSGTYTVIVTLLGCSSSASDGLYFIMTAIAKPQPFTVKVYPVPNDGRFRVYLNSGENEQVSLYVMNALGQKIYEVVGVELNGDTQQTIDLRPVPPGVYTLVIEGESLRVVRKVVVE